MGDSQPESHVEIDADQVLRPIKPRKPLVIKAKKSKSTAREFLPPKNMPPKSRKKLVALKPNDPRTRHARNESEAFPDDVSIPSDIAAEIGIAPATRKKANKSKGGRQNADGKETVKKRHDAAKGNQTEKEYEDDEDGDQNDSEIDDEISDFEDDVEEGEEEEDFEDDVEEDYCEDDLEEDDLEGTAEKEENEELEQTRLSSRRNRPLNHRMMTPMLRGTRSRESQHQRTSYLDDESTDDNDYEDEGQDETQSNACSLGDEGNLQHDDEDTCNTVQRAQDIVDHKESILQAAMRKHKVAMENLRKDSELFESLETLFSLTAAEAEKKGFGTKDLELVDAFDEEDVGIIRQHRERVDRMSALLEQDFASRLEAFEHTVGSMRRILEYRSKVLNRLEDKDQLISRYPTLARYFYQKQDTLKNLLEKTENQLTDGLVQSLAEVEALRGDVEALIEAKVR